jgi:hypothetical protein
MNTMFQKITKNEQFFSQKPQKNLKKPKNSYKILKKKPIFFQKTLKKFKTSSKKAQKPSKKHQKHQKMLKNTPNLHIKNALNRPFDRFVLKREGILILKGIIHRVPGFLIGKWVFLRNFDRKSGKFDRKMAIFGDF